MSNEHSEGSGQAGAGGPPKFHYFVDATKYDWAFDHITGAQVRAQLPVSQRGYGIFQEGHGGQPDKQVTDEASIDLDPAKQGVVRFYTAPPATFGRT